MSRPLYEISSELECLIAGLDEVGVTDEAAQAAIDAWLDGARDEIEKKMDDYCAVIQDRSSLADSRRKEAQAIQAMAQFDEAVAKSLKERAKAFFERAGLTKLRTLHFAPRVQANGGVLPLEINALVRLNPAGVLPMRFLKTVINEEEIRAALEAGEHVPGCELGERGSHFRVR